MAKLKSKPLQIQFDYEYENAICFSIACALLVKRSHPECGQEDRMLHDLAAMALYMCVERMAYAIAFVEALYHILPEEHLRLVVHKGPAKARAEALMEALATIRVQALAEADVEKENSNVH